MDEPDNNPAETVSYINYAVTGRPLLDTTQTVSEPGAGTAAAQAAGMAVQSVAQSMAIAIQDATDMLRNVSTVATTAIGVATAKWIETPEMVLYKEIITTAQGLIQAAATDFATIGKNASSILSGFPVGATKD
jgi:hypothetical protein